MIDALKQAIEALEPFSTYGRPGSRDVETYRAITAITALRAAIEAAERAEPSYWQEEARRYAENADYWRGKYEAAIEHPPAITDEIVERAALAVVNMPTLRMNEDVVLNLDDVADPDYWRAEMRAALEAAWGVKHVDL